MISFILKRLLLTLLIVWGILSLTFLLIHLAPGDPLSLYVDPEISPRVVENIRHQLGLDQSLWKQYFTMMIGFLRGNFGISFLQKRPVSELFSEALPNTLKLTLVVFILQLVLGTLLGIFTGIRKNSKTDQVFGVASVLFYSIPGFWLALMLILLFTSTLGWLPSGQMSTLGLSGGFWTMFWDRVKHLILPVTVLVLPFVAYTARFVRGSFCEVLEQDYIRTAFAFGIRRRKIYFKYGLKNALLPVVTLIGLYFPFLLGGAVITEYIFAWPGVGRLTVAAIFTHDYPVILASTVIAALSVNIGNLFSDLLYHLIDPRIKLGKL